MREVGVSLLFVSQKTKPGIVPGVAERLVTYTLAARSLVFTPHLASGAACCVGLDEHGDIEEVEDSVVVEIG